MCDSSNGLVEGYISLYKINENGQLMKYKEQVFSHKEKYKQTYLEQMQLRLSQDSKLISVAWFKTDEYLG